MAIRIDNGKIVAQKDPHYVPFMRKLPFAIHNTESDIFIWWACTEMHQDRFVIPRFFNNFICRSLCFVNKIRIKNVELDYNNL